MHSLEQLPLGALSGVGTKYFSIVIVNLWLMLDITHIAGVDNICADWLSRGQVARFLKSPGVHDPLPTILLPLPTLMW